MVGGSTCSPRFRSWFPASSHHRSRDALNRSKLGTVVCVPLTSNLKWAEAPGNLYLAEEETGLPKPSVANASQVVSLDRRLLTQRVGKLSRANPETVLTGIYVVFGR